MGELSKIPSKGVEKKRERGSKDFKKGGKLGQGVGTLKRGGLKHPYKLCRMIF